MQTICIQTHIAAAIQRCFLLSLSMDFHVKSAAQTRERAIAGVTHGIIGPGESVTWQGRHFAPPIVISTGAKRSGETPRILPSF